MIRFKCSMPLYTLRLLFTTSGWTVELWRNPGRIRWFFRSEKQPFAPKLQQRSTDITVDEGSLMFLRSRERLDTQDSHAIRTSPPPDCYCHTLLYYNVLHYTVTALLYFIILHYIILLLLYYTILYSTAAETKTTFVPLLLPLACLRCVSRCLYYYLLYRSLSVWWLMPYASGVVLEPGESKTKDLKSPPRDATRLPETESGARCLYWIKTTRKSHKQTQETKDFIR